LAADGGRYVSAGTLAERLTALQARASAALGDGATALAALRAAETACDGVRVDEVGGVFTFPQAKQVTYAGTTLLAIGGTGLATRAVA